MKKIAIYLAIGSITVMFAASSVFAENQEDPGIEVPLNTPVDKLSTVEAAKPDRGILKTIKLNNGTGEILYLSLVKNQKLAAAYSRYADYFLPTYCTRTVTDKNNHQFISEIIPIWSFTKAIGKNNKPVFNITVTERHCLGVCNEVKHRTYDIPLDKNYSINRFSLSTPQTETENSKEISAIDQLTMLSGGQGGLDMDGESVPAELVWKFDFGMRGLGLVAYHFDRYELREVNLGSDLAPNYQKRLVNTEHLTCGPKPAVSETETFYENVIGFVSDAEMVASFLEGISTWAPLPLPIAAAAAAAVAQ